MWSLGQGGEKDDVRRLYHNTSTSIYLIMTQKYKNDIFI